MTTSNLAVEELVAPGLTVELRGKTYPVQPIDGFGYQLLSTTKGENEAIQAMYRIAARCLKGVMAPEEVIGTEDTIGLSAEEAAKVLSVASTKVRTVEALASPNSEQAGTKTSAKPLSSPV